MRRVERVRRWVDGELDAAEEAALFEDAERDPALMAELEGAATVGAALEALEVPEVPADLVDRSVLRAVQARHAEDAVPAWRRWLRGRPIVLRLRPASVVVGVAAIVAVGLWLRAGPDLGSSDPVAPDPSADPSGRVARSAEGASAVAEVLVRLVLPAEGAETVAVAGDFNGWSTAATPLEDPEGDGVFVGTLRLPPGSYAYMFVVDGDRWVTDPYAVNHRDDGFGNRNAVLRVD